MDLYLWKNRFQLACAGFWEGSKFFMMNLLEIGQSSFF